MANLARVEFDATDENGNLVASPTVQVTSEATAALAALFSDRTGAAAMTNPYTAGTDGKIAFHVAGGSYRIDVTKNAITRTIRYRAVGTAGEVDTQGLTALIDTVTSSTKGAAPASGGGTTNFLRADGTWTAPISGSGSITYNQGDTGAVTRTLTARLQDRISVTDFGADPTGVADSVTMIQAAIDSLPASGGTVWFPAGTYKVSDRIRIGNGSETDSPSVMASTRSGVVLQAEGMPTFPVTAGMQLTPAVKLNYTGSGDVGVIEVAGALDGWGIHGFYIDANSNAQCCVYLNSASFGHMSNCRLMAASVGALYTTAKSSLRNSQENLFQNIWITIPAIADAAGIHCEGSTVNNSCLNTFLNMIIGHPGVSVRTYGIFLGCCDTSTFQQIHQNNISSGNTRAISFNYSGNPQGNNFPNGCGFIHCDFGGGLYEENGSPSSICNPHWYVGCTRTNGGTLPNLANAYVFDEYVMRSKVRTFSTLDSNPGDGARSFITDCNASTFFTNAAGGGSNHVPVFYSNGTWKIG